MKPEQELHCCDAKLCDKCESEFKRRSFPKVIQHPAWTRYFKKHPLDELGIRIVVDDTLPKLYFVRLGRLLEHIAKYENRGDA